MNLQGREVVLFGHVMLCEKLYIQLRGFLSIAAIITSDKEESRFADEKRLLPVRYIEDWMDYDKDSTYLISCYQAEWERDQIDRVLEKAGLFFEEDYTDAFYLLSYYRHQLNVDWTQRRIWIFGAGNNGKWFYESCQVSGIKICGFLSNMKEETLFCGLPVIRPAELDSQEAYIVICSDAWEEMSGQLDQLGYESFKDYAFPEWIPKKMFVAIGPCQVYYIAKMLCRNQRFQALWNAVCVFTPIGNAAGGIGERRLCAYGKICDAVFYRAKSLGDEGMPDHGQKLVQKYYDKAKKIFIPFYYFLGQQMQASRGINPYWISLDYAIWFRGDQEINRLVEAGYPTEEIVKKVSDIGYWPEEEIMDNFQKELHKIRVLDRLSSIKISGFIMEHYQEFPIFRDGTHMGIELTLFIANGILRILGLPAFSEDEARQAISETEPSLKNVMPIYPCVKKALKMRDAEGKYSFVKNDLSVDWVDFDEYVRRYAEYVYAVKMIKSRCGSTFW